MDAEKIIQDLNRRFAAPLPEFYKRRIIFWYDEDREFTDKLDEININGAKIVALTGSNNFHVKKLLAVDDPMSNYLVYCPLSYESPEDDWLLDMELYGEEFRADLISMWMDEMGVEQTPALRRGFKMYRRFFDAAGRRAAVKAQKTSPSTPAQLQMAIMAALASLKDAKPAGIIRAVLQAGLQADGNPVYQAFVKYGIDEAFWRMTAQGSGYEAEEPVLNGLAAHLLLTAATRTMQQDHLAGLQQFISLPHQAWCYDFVSDWMHSEDTDGICEIAEYTENELQLPKRFMKLSVPDLLDTEIFPSIHEVILVKLMNDISDHIIDPDTILQVVEKRRTCVWYERVKNFYEGILQVARMQAFFKEHAGGFHTVEPAKIWKEYTSEYYVMDCWYRRFHQYYAAQKTDYRETLSDLFTHVMEKAEGLYTGWYLGQLGENWSDACADSLRDCGCIPEIPKQTDFYREKVGAVDYKVFVIISDALRYDVAASLAERLQRETQAKVDLKSMQAIFPTVTKFGMAALLPHRKLTVERKGDQLSVLADGESTESYNREKILQNADDHSIVLKFRDLMDLKTAERKTLVRDRNVVYIYHDTIDEAGHLESGVFDACERSIDELRTMVRIITNEWSGVHVLITADHGFLYTHLPLKEDSKIGGIAGDRRLVELGRRYAIMEAGAEPEYLLPVKFLEGSTPYEGFAPRESTRIKMKGGGLNFVHGGISLQEMVVPVIEYHFLRNQSKEYMKNKNRYDTKPVEIGLLSSGRKISNMIFSLNFYQKEAVGGNREAATYQLFFTDAAGQKISDVQTIIADKTGEDAQERTFRTSFNLKSLKYSSTDSYYLVIADDNGLQVQREEFQIDIAFAVDEFDFFG